MEAFEPIFNQNSSIPEKRVKNLILTSETINQLKSLPDDLEKLTCINCNLKSFPPGFKFPSSLRYFSCENNSLTSLPELPKSLKSLICINNKLTSLPNFPSSLRFVNCSYNKLESLPRLNNVVDLYAKNNKIKVFPELGSQLRTLELSYNNIEKIPKSYKDSDIKLGLLENPIAEKLYHIETPDLNLIEEREYNKEKFQVITFKKGTVLFRGHQITSLIREDFIGLPKKSSLLGEEYYLSPDHLVWYSLSPFDTLFGSVKSINILQQDVKVILGLLPSEEIGRDIILYGETRYHTNCHLKKFKREVQQSEYSCFKDDFLEQHPDIMGSFQIFPGDDRALFSREGAFVLDYETFYRDREITDIPEVILYPRKIRDTKDRILPANNFTNEWFTEHIDEFNVRPLHIFELCQNIDTFKQDLEKYKKIIDQFLSPEGFKIDGVNYHMTMNKRNRDFVIAEFADESLLKHCVPVSIKNKIGYMKRYD